jgi:two-component system cell cycle sensor histidine kinase/response regulator CckA
VEVIVSTRTERSDVWNSSLLSPAASLAAVIVGSLSLLGWLLRIPALTSIFPGAAMKPNTAMCLVLAGVSLWLIQQRPGEMQDSPVQLMPRVLGGTAGLVGLLTFAEYLFRLSLGIDDVLFRGAVLATGVLHPGRMSGATALGFLLLGGSVLFMSNRKPYPAQGLALLAFLNGFIPCVGYLLNAKGLYQIPGYSSMALHVAILFVVTSMGVLAARPRLGVMAVVTSDSVGGVMARRVLPLVLVVPVIFSWLRWRTQPAGPDELEMRIAISTLFATVTFAAVLWLSAKWLNGVDEGRREVERRNYDLAAIVESSTDAIFSKDLSGTIINWNRGAERLYGYSAAEMIGKPITTIIPPEQSGEITQILREIAAGRSVTFEQAARQRKDGSLVDVSLIISPVRDPKGQIVGASTIAHDVTERKRAEDALRDSEARYHRLFETAKDGILILDEHSGLIIDVNPFLIKLLDYPREEFLGKSLWDIGPFRQIRESKAAFQELKDNQYIRYEDMPLETRTGQRVNVEFVSNVYGVNGTSVIQCNIRDITARKQAEESSAAQTRSLARRTEELLRSQQALEEKTLLLQSVLDSMPEGLLVSDERQNFLIWNPAAEKIIGLGPANMPSQEWTKHYGILQPDRETPFPPEQDPLVRAIQGESSRVVMFVRNSRLAEGVFVEASASPLKDKNGIVRGSVVAFRDMTERMRTEERLREYERVVENLEDMIVVVDRDYRYVIANRAFLTYRDLKKEQVIGRRVDEVLEKETFDSVVKAKMDECFQGRFIQYELQNYYPTLGERVLVVSYFPIEGPTGITRIACVLRDITERKLAEEELRKSEERFSKAFRGSPLAVTISTEADGLYLDVNDAYLQMVGRKREDVVGSTVAELNFWTQPSHRIEMLRQLRERGRVTGFRAPYATSKGEIREADMAAELIELEGQACVLVITRDITETLQLEAQFRQAQKMEAVGRLAGGVAHDFNNMLGVIIGYSDLSLGLIAPESPANRYMEQIKKASHRAVGLTRQLLAFSRQQVIFPKILDLNDVVQNVTTMLQRLVGDDVAISFRPTVPIDCIKADPGQIEQILMNLVVNAQDAMPGGGEIMIQTGHADLDEHYASRHPGSHAGPHVVLSVSDTGCGMDEKIKAQIFDPFFTTKAIGQGTGLGLSTVYGIVKQGGGTIFVYSEPGRGTTFKIYFPRVTEKAEVLPPSHDEGQLPRGSETILVVEDDLPLRELTVSMLQGAGYRVIEAGNAEAALDILNTSEREIDLLLSDVIMPGKSGVELLALAKAIRPNLRSLFVSGYTGDLIALRGGVVPEASFLEKPFTRSALLKKVRSALHSGQ